MEKMKLKYVNKSPNVNPEYKHEGDSGFDLRAWLPDGDLIIKPFERVLIHTGLYLDIPDSCEVQVRPRSGTALKKGLTVLNTPGTVDEPYTGEICIIAINLSNTDILVTDGERIAQAVVCPVYSSKYIDLVEVDVIVKDTTRGAGGFNSTGTH